ncbi:DEAD/DEAH box helicase family protein [Pontiellaceae bacterium B12219]|nr:DEAD/DEAH box helicase family protein [Pontiellaceae bacterium B12219]
MSEPRENTFLTDPIMQGGDWRALELAVSRLLQHCGWRDIQYVGETGDKGADVLAVRGTDSYLVQVKAVSSSSYVGKSAIDQAIVGQSHYKARIVVVATNGDFTRSAYTRRDELKAQGYDVRLWNGKFLLDILSKWPAYGEARRVPRPYQSKIIQSVVESHKSGRQKALFVVATGLGKTVIAATIADKLFHQGYRKVLVLCHATDLATQLQQSFWGQMSKEIPSRIFMGGEPPVPSEGVTFGLYQTLFGYLGGIDPTAFDLIIIDEAHHALANAFSSCVEHLSPKLLIGMTATPWRGDGATVESVFGEPVAKVSLIDGMRMGFLAKVDYRLMCDNVDWEQVPKLAHKSLSIRDLNKRLFIPQRDDAVIDHLLKVIKETPSPRVAVFSPSKNHADAFAAKLVSSGISAANLSVDDKIKRRQILLSFSSGKIQAVTAVDVLNEGIDVPDVNILVFLRATHSRRIFVQQLGRGLRISKGKEKVVVLDFVTDIRRIAAVRDLNMEAKEKPNAGEVETVYLRDGVVTFSNDNVQRFVDAWLLDVASLQDCDDAEKLAFPEVETYYGE